MKRKKKTSIRKRMLTVSVCVLLLMCIGVGLLFLDTTERLRARAAESSHYSGLEIARNVDEILTGVQYGSETLADNERLREIVSKTYTADESQNKKSDLLYIQNSIFDSFHRQQSITQIAAFYNAKTGELFNFGDGNRDDADLIERLLAMGISDPANLSRYIWHPLQEDFLAEKRSQNLREAAVIFGSRRLFRHDTLTYPIVQIFAIEERTLFESYRNTQRQTSGEVFVLRADGSLLSSSREESVAQRAAPEDLVAAVLARSEDSFVFDLEGVSYFVNVSTVKSRIGRDDQGPWISVLLIPEQTVMRDVYRSYALTFFLLLIFFVLSGFVIFYMYRRFMKPISQLSEAMQQVDSGNPDAFVKVRGDDSETDLMLQRYNLMLSSIHISTEQRVQLERVKRDLDLQVLTNQINPHFLYNTLETIVWKAYESERPDIGKIASSLGRLYRLTVKGDHTWTTLSHEMDHVRSYIDIQNARYEGLFLYSCSFDDALVDFRLPKLILQPLVENVFLHAIEKKTKMILIRVRARICSDGAVEIKVVDNGPGISPEVVARLRSDIAAGSSWAGQENGNRSSGSIGIRNVAARLHLYMGEPNAIQIFCKPGWGTKIVIRLRANPSDDKYEL